MQARNTFFFRVIRNSVILLACISCNAWAATIRAKDTKIISSDVTFYEVEFDYKNDTITRKVACYGSSVGTTVTIKKILYFRTLKEQQKALAVDYKKNVKNKKKSSGIKAKQDELKALIKASNGICLFNAQPTPPPAVAPTVPAAPTAPPAGTPDPNANFDSAGNVTEKGKILFAIPSNLTANILRGLEAQSYFSCNGCHVERGGYDFNRLKTGTNQDPMNTFGLTDQNLADLAAYLNRTRIQ